MTDWLGAFRSDIAEIQQTAQQAAKLVARYDGKGRRVPDGLFRRYRRELVGLIESYHGCGDGSIRAARFALDALLSNRCAPVCGCGWVMAVADRHDGVSGVVCGVCCTECAAA